MIVIISFTEYLNSVENAYTLPMTFLIRNQLTKTEHSITHRLEGETSSDLNEFNNKTSSHQCHFTYLNKMSFGC